MTAEDTKRRLAAMRGEDAETSGGASWEEMREKIKSGAIPPSGEAAAGDDAEPDAEAKADDAASGEDTDGWRLPTRPLPFTHELCEPPGVVGIMSHYITETARCPRPCLSLAASVALWGTLFGRWYVTEERSGNKTNFYVTVVVESSGGKDHPQKVIKCLVQKCKAIDIVESRVTSDTAIEMVMNTGWNVKLFLMDECGAFLKGASAANKNGATGQDTILECFKELFSCADSWYKSKCKADRVAHPVITIDKPQANFYGSTTPEAFAAGMSPHEIEGGWTGRCLVFMDEAFVRGEDRPTVPYPEVLLAAIQRFKPVKSEAATDILGCGEKAEGLAMPWEGKANPAADAPSANTSKPKPDMAAEGYAEIPEPKTVFFTPDAKDVYRRFQSQLDDLREQLTKKRDPYRAIWGKVAENAKKLGLLYAASRSAEDGSDPSIDTAAATWGCRVAYTCASNLYLFASEHGGESEYAELKSWALREIKATGTQGITRRELGRRRRGMKTVDRDEVLDDLLDVGDIVEADASVAGDGKKGRPTGGRLVAACWLSDSAKLGKDFCPDVMGQNAFCPGQNTGGEG